jgi:primosomal protein N' (replication factor Y)
MQETGRAPGEDGEYVNVILDLPGRQLDRPFTYLVPPHLRDRIMVGSMVMVPFVNRIHLGYVLEFCAPPPLPRIRPVDNVIDEPPFFDREMVELCKWMASRYLCPLSQVIKLIVPPGRARRVVETVELAVEGDDALADLPSRAHRQREVVAELAARGGRMNAEELSSAVGAGSLGGILTTLEKKGLVKRRFVLPPPRTERLEVRTVTMTPRGWEESEKNGGTSAPARRRILETLRTNGGRMDAPELLRHARASSSTLKACMELGLVRVEKREKTRDPYASGSFPFQPPHRLNEEQESAFREIRAALDAGRGGVFLLHGVTGSGKTEIYLHAIEYILQKGKTSLVLVPEISLTPQMVQRFKARLGEEVAVLHSGLGTGERYDQWRGIREGRYRVVIGARSALFAPLHNLGLVVIDEEHENTYKQGSPPRYHAIEVAEKRAELSSAVLLLGSATPRLESYKSAVERSRGLLVLSRRVDGRPLPETEVVDMREYRDGAGMTILSAPLVNHLAAIYREGGQAVLFINRRGFARFLQCFQCGHILQCPRCSVSLCYHARESSLLCHHCGWRAQFPSSCPRCGNRKLRLAGVGTERVEAELRRVFPPLRCIRMDSDTTRRKGSHWRLLEEFRQGKAQVLLGTQMIAKGLDIPSVTLVGVINADTTLGLPDFRAAERTFQLLTQVSGRAGRGDRPGKVIIQTYNPDHYAVQAASRGDYGDFYRREISFRRDAGYPPFRRLVNLVTTSSREDHVEAASEKLGAIVREKLETEEVLGPAPCPLSRVKGRYRYHLLVKTSSLRETLPRLEEALLEYDKFKSSYLRRTGLRADELSLAVDVDPSSLL